MVSKNQKKLIRSLKQKKYRKQHGLFVVEGIKVIREFLNTHYVLKNLFVLNAEVHLFHEIEEKKRQVVSELELSQLSFLTTPQKAVAVFEIPVAKTEVKHEGLQVVLDDVKDPGNLGTIIRLCDWFGVERLICSNETVDCYNPKVVQATMGSLTRISVIYTSISGYIKEADVPVIGAFMDGENVYQATLPKKGLLIMGNEANGISATIEKEITQKIAIPRFGVIQQTESLNVATATAILLSEFRRGV
ncbi:TrmH family RNA methyltransferase [Aquimarina agarilytica]|uniref:TrmH family RNA methyltransferase n=1 Tax=Aquimarina agarilytica TaxID=1087449 RepID=UPI0002890CED|nr:RNA methyltransferase [Aquimarina agarilytica]